MSNFDEWYEKNKFEMERLSLKLALNTAYLDGVHEGLISMKPDFMSDKKENDNEMS